MNGPAGKRLIGVGVGPGDPELVTVKGVGALRAADVVVVPVMDTLERGRAEATVLHYVDASKIVRVVFALNERQDRERREAAWDAAGKTPERNLKGADGLHQYKTDIELTQGLGCNAFRTSIEWGRIEPQEGHIDQQAVAYYHDLLREMHAHGQTPVITLHHFSHPQWIAEQGGWENKETAQKFARFAGFCAKEFGADVDTWLTFNEPNVYLAGAYLAVWRKTLGQWVIESELYVTLS